jgi:DNA-binding transcriptional LysR family regulator
VYLAPDWVQQFRAQYPQITVSLQTDITPQIVAEVLGHRLDIGFIEGELDGSQPPRLAVQVFEAVEQKLVAGFKHAWWERTVVSLEELRSQSLIVRPAQTQSRLWLEQALREHGIEPVIGAEFDNLEAMKRAVIGGLCLAVLPPYVFQREVEQGLLHVISIEGRPLVRHLKVIWDQEAYFSPVTRAFLNHLSATYPALKPLVGEK